MSLVLLGGGTGSARAASLSGWTGFVCCKINKLLLVFTWLSSCVVCKERQHRVHMQFVVPFVVYTRSVCWHSQAYKDIYSFMCKDKYRFVL